MRCFYHHDAEAVGVCKNCGRGVCADCASEVDNGIACRQRCEDEVRALNRLTDRSKLAYGRARSAYVRIALFYFVVGLAFMIAGMFNWHRLAWGLTPAGVIFTVMAFLHYSMARKFDPE
jgi:hypothetical protein